MKPLLIWLLLGLLACGWSGRSEAATTCSVTSITDVAFGTVDPTSGMVDATATLNYSCTYTGVLSALYGDYIRMCFSIGTGSQPSFDPRQMLNASNDSMNFQLYKDSGHSQIWGTDTSGSYTPAGADLNFTILSGNTTRTGSLTIYGRVPGLQSHLSAGDYSSVFNDGNFSYRYNEALLSLGTYPASCTAGGDGGTSVAMPTFNATAKVVPACTLGTATALSFGNVSGLLRSDTDQFSLLHLSCTNRTAWQVGLNNGQNASGAVRRMVRNGRYITYELYRDSQRTQRWGNTLNTDTAPGSGSGAEQTLNVYGRVPAQAAAAAGDYSDVITVTVTY
jgi:spore coat protein U-like protein